VQVHAWLAQAFLTTLKHPVLVVVGGESAARNDGWLTTRWIRLAMQSAATGSLILDFMVRFFVFALFLEVEVR